MEEFGKALVVEPWLGTVVIGGGLLKRRRRSGAGAYCRDEIQRNILARDVLMRAAGLK